MQTIKRVGKSFNSERLFSSEDSREQKEVPDEQCEQSDSPQSHQESSE
jgi:hypothetical protein